MTSGVLTGWDLFWVLPVAWLALVLLGVGWAFRRGWMAERRWAAERAETRRRTHDWLEVAGWRPGGLVLHDTAVGDQGVRRWAEDRERELRAAAWYREQLDEVAVTVGVDFGVERPTPVVMTVRCADCGYQFPEAPHVGETCPMCGSAVRRHTGVTWR